MIGVIGTGNMGGAIIKGLLSADLQVGVFDVNPDAMKVYKDLGAAAFSSVSELLKDCLYVILTVKPNIYPEVLKEINDTGYDKTVITVAPGFSVERTRALVPRCRVVRTMPNTPALVGEGVILIADENDDYSDITKMLSALGKTYLIKESLMDAGIALSGSSPAFIYNLVDIMADCAVSMGFTKAQAVEIAARTVLGSAKMVLSSDDVPTVLKDRVCSPGGTTIAGMLELSACGFENAVVSAMKAVVKRAEELSK